jgi:hypothetical protein
MCLPDVRRIFDEAMAAARSLGALLDNWLDVALVIVENAVNSGDAPACDAVDKRVSALEFSAELFGSNNTAVVGVSGSLFALTDGVLIEYVDAGGSAENVVAPFGTGWPIEVDVSLGVAVVSLGSGADSRRGDGTGLLGCRCDDSEGVMKVTCAVAPHFESTTESIAPQVFEAGFQVSLLLVVCSKILTGMTTGALDGAVHDVRGEQDQRAERAVARDAVHDARPRRGARGGRARRRGGVGDAAVRDGRRFSRGVSGRRGAPCAWRYRFQGRRVLPVLHGAARAGLGEPGPHSVFLARVGGVRAPARTGLHNGGERGRGAAPVELGAPGGPARRRQCGDLCRKLVVQGKLAEPKRPNQEGDFLAGVDRTSGRRR